MPLNNFILVSISAEAPVLCRLAVPSTRGPGGLCDGRRAAVQEVLGTKASIPLGRNSSRFAWPRLRTKISPKLIHLPKTQYFMVSTATKALQGDNVSLLFHRLMRRSFDLERFQGCNYLHYGWNFMEQFNLTTAMRGNQAKETIIIATK
ncbi:hypothetical protein E2C01_097683 [Portunus trituberculatus]|uniref:Uncharacterized protein n=1 Tax=Portunus trituberculatus TaxID=210409 RepID=A0A5B7K6D5_PORTR|nr:hypothetical protein [Portunus trituberculatus]